jgi:hypothetical protein
MTTSPSKSASLCVGSMSKKDKVKKLVMTPKKNDRESTTVQSLAIVMTERLASPKSPEVYHLCLPSNMEVALQPYFRRYSHKSDAVVSNASVSSDSEEGKSVESAGSRLEDVLNDHVPIHSEFTQEHLSIFNLLRTELHRRSTCMELKDRQISKVGW